MKRSMLNNPLLSQYRYDGKYLNRGSKIADAGLLHENSSAAGLGITDKSIYYKYPVFFSSELLRQYKKEMERKVLEFQAKALGAQMSPHFIFNCMNSIKSLIQKNEQEKAIDYLTTFSKLIRTVFQNSDKKEISLFDEIETCRLYTQLESMRFSNKLNYIFNIDERTDFKSIMVPPLILQPFIENAIWHGLMPKAEGGIICVHVTEKEGKIYCIVEDDGIGRSVSMRNKFNDSTSGHQSKGMRLTQSRLELHNSLNQRNATVEIIDKTNETGEAAGTKVILVFNEE